MQNKSRNEHSYAFSDAFSRLDKDKFSSDVTEKKTPYEHSYAYSDTVQAFLGKERDHCYSFKGMDLAKIPKQGVQKEHSYSSYRVREFDLSDDEISDSAEQSLFSKDPYYYQLPQYKSSDSALDITSFDSISDKCLSSENLNVLTVEVFTERSIMHGKSDPDISRMTLQSSMNVQPSGTSVRSRFNPSKPLNKERMVFEHNYSVRKKPWIPYFDRRESEEVKVGFCWSPLQDHSYDLSEKKIQAKINPSRKVPLFFPKSSFLDHTYQSLYFPKSPFLDHTYQLIRKNNHDNLPVLRDTYRDIAETDKDMSDVYTFKTSCNKKTDIMKSVFDSNIVKRANIDHAYGKKSDGNSLEVRIRSNSLSDFRLGSSDFLSDDRMDDDSSESDSGTESLNGVDETPMLIDSSDNKSHNDHPYFNKTMETVL